ncbi:MAG: TPM domain-containing protein [Lachnospiraceae bacterium]|nr:TPM domain-containing protein [Lachnospiraceae bacterium]
MKKVRYMTAVLSLLLTVFLIMPAFACSVTVRAEELWSEDYYRAADSGDALSEAEMEDLDGICLDIVKNYQLDLGMLSASTAEIEEHGGFEALAQDQYESCGYGYGENKDGFMVVCDRETGETHIYAYGSAVGRLDEGYIQFAEEKIPGYLDQYGVYGLMYVSSKYIRDELEKQAQEQPDKLQPDEAAQTQPLTPEEAAQQAQTQPLTPEDAAQQAQDAAAADPAADQSYVDAAGNVRIGPGKALPAWYPADPENFTFYHDETAPRVVDKADILTDEMEQNLESRLAQFRSEYNRDLVIYTDTTSYEMGHDIWAADFYDFNGYGCTQEREGACLFICMDPADRGFFTCATGSDTRGLFTEEAANIIDDMLYGHFRVGEYSEGLDEWITMYECLYTKGYPYAPSWMPDRGQTFTRAHNDQTPRINDEAGLYSEQEIQQLTQKAKQISEKYGIDIAVETTTSQYGMYIDTFSRQYFEYNGLGYGEEYDGILLTIVKKRGERDGRCYVYASGKGTEKLTDVNRRRLEGYVEDEFGVEDDFGAANEWLDHVDHMERTGRVSRSLGYWIFMVLLGGGAGSLVGGFSLLSAEGNMATPQAQVNADQYLVPNSLRLTSPHVKLMSSKTVRKYIPPVTTSSSGSSSSGGGSSYSSSYSGSSGASHSGSGRSF